MFPRISAAILLALPLLAAADCNSGTQQCCNNVFDAKNESGLAHILNSLLGVEAQSITGLIGLTCSPLVSGAVCMQQTVCCENNNFNGLVAVGCSPINVNL